MQTYKLLEQDSVLLSQPLLIKHFGRAGSQFLSQLHYWLEKKESLGCKHDGSHWIFNSAESWAEQLHLSVRQIRRLISNFVKSGILRVEKLNPYKSIRTNYYSIDYDKLNAAIGSQKNHKNPCLVHSAILSPSSCHNGTICIETKTTNKDINKSEDLPIEQVGQMEIKRKLVKPVDNFNLKKLEKSLDTTDSETPPNRNTEIQTLAVPLQKTSTSKDMLAIWNEVLGDKAQASMSKELAPLLVSAYAKKFNKNLERWRIYCETLKSSSYLMGNQFQLSIFWALKFTTIDRIRAGEFGVKRNTSDYGDGQGSTGNATIEDNQVQQFIEELEEPTEIKAMRFHISQAIGAAAYHSWFHQAKFVSKDGKIQMVAPNRFVEYVWETQFPWIQQGKME